MTDDEVRRLLALKSEGPNLDYKVGFEWSKPNRDLKYELVRDLIALANTKDGGRVVFGVRDADLEFVGVSAEIFESIDPSGVVGMLHDNAAPKVQCAVYKRVIDGKRVVVFDVAEFEDTPIICTNAISSQDGSKRLILRQSAIYIRTGAGTIEEISAPDDMRSLIERAVRRKADELLKSFRDILTGRPAALTADAAALYQPEIAAAEEFLKSRLGRT
ncbi:MAG TPA: ATP-binding protein [Methylomirabilota bacterium]|nr:ATP-binding protein [Methylomirabilota bacterium]